MSSEELAAIRAERRRREELRQIKAEKERRKAAQSVTPLQSFARGVRAMPARTVGGALSLAGMAADVGSDLANLIAGQPRRGESFADQWSRPAMEAGEAAAGTVAPRGVGRANRIAEIAGEVVPSIGVGALSSAGRLGTLGARRARAASNATAADLARMQAQRSARMAAGRETVLGAAAPAVGELARMAGQPELGMVAELAVGSGAPATVLQRIAPGTLGAPRMWQDAAARRSRRMIGPDADPDTPRWRDEAASALETEVERAGGDPFRMRPSEQVLAAEAAAREIPSNFESLAIRKTQGQRDSDFVDTIQAQKRRTMEQWQAQRAETVPDVDTSRIGRVQEGLRRRVDEATARNQALWDEIDLDNRVGPASRQYLDEAIAEIEKVAGETNRDVLPIKQIRQIQGYVDGVPWGELQRLRSRFNAIWNEASGPSPTAVQRLRGRKMAPRMIEAIDRTIESAPDDLAQLWPEAIDSHRRLRSVYDPSTTAYRTIMEQGNPVKFVSDVMDSKFSVAETRRVVEMLEGDADALRSFRESAIQDTLTPATEMGAKALRNRFEKRRAALGEVFTQDELAVYDEVLQQDIAERASKAGRRGQDYGPGSPTQQAEAFRFPTLARAYEWLLDKGMGTVPARNLVMEQLIVRPDLLAQVLRADQTGAAGDFGRLMTSIMARAALYQDSSQQEPRP